MRVWVIFVLAAALLVLPWAIRWSEGNFHIGGENSYYHARLGMSLANGERGMDKLVVEPRPFGFSPYHVVLAIFYKIFGNAAFVLLPMLIAWISVLLFWIVSQDVGLSRNELFWALLAFVLSPPLLASGFLVSPHGFVVMLFLAAVALLRSRFWLLGAAFVVLAAWCGLPFLLGMLGGVLLMIFVWPDRAPRLNVLASVLLIMLIAGWYAPLPIEQPGLESFVSDLGGLFGIGLFTMLLGLVGLLLLWEYKRRFFGAFLCVIGSLVAGFFFPGVIVVFSVVLSMLVGLALARLWARKWEIGQLKDAAMLVLFCGLLFSAVSHVVELGKAPPSPGFFESIAQEPGVMLTYREYGFWTEFAGHVAVLDGREVSPKVAGEVAQLWASTDVERTLALLEKYKIRYIVITPQMTQGLVWDREEQGLDFLVRRSEMFKRVDPGLSTRVYEVQ